jgi:hypothetical protein
MIKASFSSLAGAWIAHDVAHGEIPENMAVPLTLLASRLPTPVLVAGTIAYGVYRLNIEARARRAKDVTPNRRSNSAAQPTSSQARRKKRST